MELKLEEVLISKKIVYVIEKKCQIIQIVDENGVVENINISESNENNKT